MRTKILLLFVTISGLALAQVPEPISPGAKSSGLGPLGSTPTKIVNNTSNEKNRPQPPKQFPVDALGVSYHIYSPAPQGKFVQRRVVDTFHSGERIQLVILPSSDGYLRVLARQDQEPFSHLFPHPKLANGAANVKALEAVRIPLRFDGRPGKIEVLLAFVSQKSPNQSLLMLAQDTTPASNSKFAQMMLTTLEVGARGLEVDVDDSPDSPADFAILKTGSPSLARDNLAVPVRFFLRHQ